MIHHASRRSNHPAPMSVWFEDPLGWGGRELAGLARLWLIALGAPLLWMTLPLLGPVGAGWGNVRAGESPFAPAGTDGAKASDGASGAWRVGEGKLYHWDAPRRMRVGARPDLEVLIFIESEKKRHAVPWVEVAALRQEILAEGREEEWRWREGGSNEKIHTGRSYPWRKYGIALRLRDGRVFRGRLTRGFPLRLSWVATSLGGPDNKDGRDGSTTWSPAWPMLIQPDSKGGAGSRLRDLNYVESIVLDGGAPLPPAPPAEATGGPEAKDGAAPPKDRDEVEGRGEGEASSPPAGGAAPTSTTEASTPAPASAMAAEPEPDPGPKRPTTTGPRDSAPVSSPSGEE